ncbi:MAG: transcriptional regulator [Gammaproteobacteria bacterium]|nr:transcriptional regulator [Gammaproteobacteria bacterium]
MRTRQTEMSTGPARSTSQLAGRVTLERTLSPVDQAYQHVLDGILSGELEPGMRIPTEAVADALGISRMPVRDALRRLEGDGAVTILANRGASVAEYSPDEVIELTEMRAVLEGLAARIAMERVTEDEIEELLHLKRRMEKSESDLTRWMSIHDAFHNYLTCLSGRPLLSAQTARIRLMLRPYSRRFYTESRETEIIGLEHQRIIDALLKGDADHLDETVRAHALVNVRKLADFARRD